MPKKRVLKSPKYKNFGLSKPIKHPKNLPSSRQILTKSFKLIKENWRVVAGIIAVYGLLNILLVKGIAGGIEIIELKEAIHRVFGGDLSSAGTSLGLFTYLVGTAGNTNSELASAYQTFLVVLTSLALVWTFRQAGAGKETGVRLSFYRGIYPLVPFILVLLVIGLQLIPAAIGNVIYSTVITNGLAITGMERFIWATIFFLLTLLSIYMISSSVFALYIVTLPDMTPMKALRSARDIVLNRRWAVIRKLLFFPFALLVLAIVVMLPVILWIPTLAAWAFLGLSLSALALIHSYNYTLYRELL